MKRTMLCTVFVAEFLFGCSASDETDLTRRGGAPGESGTLTGETPGDGTNAPGGAGPGSTPAQQCKDLSRKYTGLGGSDLIASRADELAGANRARVKPYSSLGNEFTRVIAVNPALLQTSAAAFGSDPARWSVEPQANAVSLYTHFRVAFQGCLTYTATDAKYAAAPTDAAAGTECAAMQRKFWSRTPQAAEIDACKRVAITDSAKETDPRRRWAYTCATILTATGFTSF